MSRSIVAGCLASAFLSLFAGFDPAILRADSEVFTSVTASRGLVLRRKLDATETITRLISVIPPHHQQQVRIQLARELHSLEPQPELVRVGGLLHRLLESDQIALVETEEGLIESLHAVLTGAHGDLIANVFGLLLILDALADVWS